MATILPKFDPGGDAGQQFGQSLEQTLQFLGKRKLADRAIDSLKNLSPEAPPEETMAAIMRAGRDIPGFGQASGELFGQLQRRRALNAMLKGYGPAGDSPYAPRQIGIGDQKGEGGLGEASLGSAPPQTGAGAMGPSDTISRSKQAVPTADQFDPSQLALTPEEEMRILQMADAANDPSLISTERAKMLEQKRQQFEARVQQREQAQLEQDRQRERAERLEQKVVTRASSVMKSRGMEAEANPEVTRMAYNIFERAQQENAALPLTQQLSEEQLMRDKVEPAVDRMINSYATFRKNAKPASWYQVDKPQRFKALQASAKSFLQANGNTEETRNMLTETLLENGFVLSEALDVVNPLHPSIKRALANFKGPEDIPKLARMFGPETSPYLMKRVMVDAGVNDLVATDAINDLMQFIEEGGVTIEPFQNEERIQAQERMETQLDEIWNPLLAAFRGLTRTERILPFRRQNV